MSGIAGIVDLSGERPVSEDELRRMGSLLAHRGPDSEGVLVSPSGTCGLLCHRLATNDIAHGTEPMPNEDGRMMLVHDGVIYNAPDLRKVLASRSHKFRGHSDGEVVLHLYEDHGSECVSALRGCFALAIWDEHNRALWLARDRLGKRPLYIAQTAGRLYFASEARAILVHAEVSREIDLEALDLYLTFQHVPAPRTIYRGVSKLRAGHAMQVTDGTIREGAFWEPTAAGDAVGDMEDWGERVFNEMFEAVKLRMAADVPVGVFLSGGIDSSIVAGLMNLAAPGQVKTFSLGLEGDEAGELEIARRAAKHFGTQHHERIVRPDPFCDAQAIAMACDEPYGDSASLPLWYLSRFAREQVTVVLTGDGGDETFLGHPRYAAAETSSRIDDAPGGASAVARRLGKRITDKLLPESRFKRKATRFLDRLGEGPEERFLAFVSTFTREDRVRYYGAALHDKMTDPWATLEPYYKRSPWPRGAGAAAYVDLFTTLPNHVMARLDAAAAAHGLDVRCPFLDHLLVETALSIPPTVRMENLRTKALLRYAFMSLVSPEILDREKAGFTLPIAKWFRGPLRDASRDLLAGPSTCVRGYFKPKAVEGILDDHASGKRDHGAKLWSLLMLELWHREHADAPEPEA